MTTQHASSSQSAPESSAPPGAAELARLLEDCPGPAGTLLETLAGGPVSVEMFGTTHYLLPDRERLLLQPAAADTAVRGTGLLRTHRGIPVAEVTAVLLPSRQPRRQDDEVPWACLLREDPAVLRGCRRSVTRMRTRRGNSGYLDAAGHDLPVCSSALLESPATGPVMLVSQGFYAEFTALATRTSASVSSSLPR